jgi:hypothetical protein
VAVVVAVGGVGAVATTESFPSISSSSRLSSSIHRDAADFVDVDDDDDERDVVDEDDGNGLPPRKGRGGSSFVVLLRDDDDDNDDDDGAIARNAPTEGTTTSTSTSTAAASDSRMVDINRPFSVASPDSAALLTTREKEVLKKFGSWVAFCVFCVCILSMYSPHYSQW